MWDIFAPINFLSTALPTALMLANVTFTELMQVASFPKVVLA